MGVFGLIFIATGVLHFVLAVVLRVPIVSGHWAHSDVPVSRLGDAAWRVCILSWGLATVLAPPEFVAPYLIGACLASFAILIPAGLYDQRLHRRRQGSLPGNKSRADG